MADIGISKFRVQIPRSGSIPSTPGFAESEGQDPVNPPGSPTGVYVPYLGATGSVNLGEFGLSTGYITFDTTPTNTPTTQGTMFWDDDDLTVDVILNGYQMKIGEDVFYPVKNQTGSNIAKGVAVRFAGTVGASGRLLIEPFTANGTYASSRFMGVTAEAIDNGEDGKVLWFGRIRGINTNAYNEGDILYASTTVAGGFQTTVPQAPNNIIEVAAVVTKSINQGVIFVRPTLGSNINRDEGVKIISPLTGQTLVYNGTTFLWENQTVSGSKWTDVGLSIYRNSNVIVGKITDSGQKFQVDGNAIITDDITVGNTSLNYFDFDVSTGILGIYSQSQYIHKYRGGASGALNMGQYDINGNASINNTSNAGLLFGTNNTTRIEVQSDGDVLLKKVDNGTGDIVTIDASTGQIRKRTRNETSEDIQTSANVSGSGLSFVPTTGSFTSVTYSNLFCSIRKSGKLFHIYLVIATSQLTKGAASGNLSISIDSSTITSIINDNSSSSFDLINFRYNSANQFSSTPSRVGYLGSYGFAIYKNTGNIADINTESRFQVSDLLDHAAGSGLKNYIVINALLEIN